MPIATDKAQTEHARAAAAVSAPAGETVAIAAAGEKDVHGSNGNSKNLNNMMGVASCLSHLHSTSVVGAVGMRLSWRRRLLTR